MSNRRGDEFFERLAAAIEPQPRRAPSRLKSRIYSALARRQGASGGWCSLTETKAAARGLCVFEHLVQIAPVGEKAKALNLCRVCHARILAETLDDPPIWWSNCPYVRFQNR